LQRYLPPDAAGYVSVPGAVEQLSIASAGQTATLLMTAGMMLLLLMVPAHGQLVAMGAHSAPMALPLMLTALPVTVLHTCFRLWEAHPTLLSGQFAFDVCRWTGIAAIALGGLAALGQRRWGALAGYVTLVDWGAGLIALGLGTRAGTELMVQMVVWRAFSLLLVGAGWGGLFKAAGRRDDLDATAGPVRRQPLSALTLIVGLLSLAGFPLSPGGLGRWALLDRAALSRPLADWPATTLVLVLSSAAAGWGVVMALGACLKQDDGRQTTDRPAHSSRLQREDQAPSTENGDDERAPDEQETEPPPHEPDARRARRRETWETLLGTGLSLLALWFIGGLALRPTPWIDLARRLVGSLTFPEG
jgi:formate hydrogenlyase subunit 3/multisubunit Na+/H+ antiporter MnhD subunit